MMNARLLSSKSPKSVLYNSKRLLERQRLQQYNSQTNHSRGTNNFRQYDNAFIFAGAAAAVAATVSTVNVLTTNGQENDQCPHQFNELKLNDLSLSSSSSSTLQNLTTKFQRFLNEDSYAKNTTTSCEAVPSLEEISSSSSSPLKNDNNYYNPSSYYYKRMEEPSSFCTESHAIFGPLKKKDLIERFSIYRLVLSDDESSKKGIKHDETKKKEVAVASIRIGKNLNGHEKIVHGGIISLLFDDSFGWGYEALCQSVGKSYTDDDAQIVVTANLNVNFRHPLPAESDFVIRVYHEKDVRKKVYLSARMESHDGSILYAESTALFIKVKNAPAI